jgi:GT2 family glycosyltransferase
VAIEHGADVLIFLDVDCIPGPYLVQRYLHAVKADGSRLLCGPVAYLPPPPPGGYRLADVATLAVPHPLRPVPAEKAEVPGGDPRLFWALSFATSTACWLRLGGFCEQYEGYGAEDTDFAQVAARNGITPTWVGGAWAYHQYHASEEPPVRHLGDILRNAAIFRDRWGWWPMQGWLHGFQAQGLAAYDASTDRWLPT